MATTFSSMADDPRGLLANMAQGGGSSSGYTQWLGRAVGAPQGTPDSSGWSDPLRAQEGSIYDWRSLGFDKAGFDTAMQTYSDAMRGFMGSGEGGPPDIQAPDVRNYLSGVPGGGGLWGKDSYAIRNPDGSFSVRRRVDAPGTAGWNSSRKHHYETANYSLDPSGKLVQASPWNQKATSSGWKDFQGDIPMIAAGVGAVLGVGALNGAFGGFGDALAPMVEVAPSSGAVASAVPEMAAANVAELGLGATPLATPAAGISPLSESLMAAGLPQATAAPGMGIASEVGLGAGATAAATEVPQMLASNYSDAAAGYGDGMSGAATSAFDTVLGLTGSTGLAAGAGGVTNTFGALLDNPFTEFLRRNKNWLSPAYNIFSGVRGMGVGKDVGRGSASQRAADAQLLQLLQGGKVAELPGYKQGEQALMRQLAAQGLLGSGNMATALADYNNKFAMDWMQGLAGLGTTPGQRLGGEQIRQESLDRVGYGIKELLPLIGGGN